MSEPSANTSTPQVELTDLCAAHAADPGRLAVEEVNWRIGAGEFWIVGGLHNSGKSALLAAASGIHRPVRGRIRLFAHDLSQAEEDTVFRQLLRVGLVFEGEGRLFARMTVAENIALPLLYHGDTTDAGVVARVDEVLAATGLADQADTLPERLPRNLRQRVGLARALALGPEVMFVDNPLSRLPLREARWWVEFLSRLNAGHSVCAHRPMTVVVGVDELAPWRETARQFAVLDGGRLTIVGGRMELESSPVPLVRELLAA